MTTDRPLTDIAAPSLEVRVAGPGERLQRLRHRQRLLREELLAVLVLLVVLAVTVAVLATQWLGSGPSTNASGPPVYFPSNNGGAT